MKVELNGDVLTSMSKFLPAHRNNGENVGILYFDERAAQLLFHEAEAALKAGGRKMWMAAAVQRVARHTPLHAVDVADLPWIEIDFPEDLASARQDVWPAIRSKPVNGSCLPIPGLKTPFRQRSRRPSGGPQRIGSAGITSFTLRSE